DGVSFVSFYEANHDKVRRAAVAFCGDRDVAADAAQESFARAYARWRRLSRKPWAAAWVMTTALNVCKRSARSKQATVPLGPHEHTGQPVPEVERVDVARALRRLPPRRRAASVLFYIGDLPISDVAAAMRLSEGAVKAHLVLARRELRKEMERSHD
ncbi:MAG TPA: sigma-70 family RNA polymerase sigma factor, partial [Actinomycetota bacterium]